MSMAPETAVSPLQQAPPDRGSRDLEQVLAEAQAIILRDGGIDQQEQAILYDFMQTLSVNAQANGGFGPRTPPGGGEPPLPQSPQEMNQNTEDYGSSPEGEDMNNDEG